MKPFRNSLFLLLLGTIFWGTIACSSTKKPGAAYTNTGSNLSQKSAWHETSELAKSLFDVLPTDQIEKLKNLDEIPENFLKALDELGAARTIFLNDFDVESLEKFVDQPELIDSWKVLEKFAGARRKASLSSLSYIYAHPDERASIIQGLGEVSAPGAFINQIHQRVLKHPPSSGAIVYKESPSGTFLIGSYPPDLRYILEELNYPKMATLNLEFPVPSQQQFNLLNVSSEVYEAFKNAEKGFFRSVNGPWIDHGVKSKVPIIVVSDVHQFVYRLEEGIKTLTGFGKEVHRLEWIHGYRYDPGSRRMLPPSQAGDLPTITQKKDYDHGL